MITIDQEIRNRYTRDFFIIIKYQATMIKNIKAVYTLSKSFKTLQIFVVQSGKSITDVLSSFKVLILNHIGLDCIPVIDLFWTQFKIFQSPNFNHHCSLMTILVQSWQNHRRLHSALLNLYQKIKIHGWKSRRVTVP